MYTDLIREIYPDLSPGYRKIADFLVNHYRDAAFMTASELARTTGVDTAQVVRLAQRLGYPGYPELISEVQERVKQDLRNVYEPDLEDKTPAGVLLRTLTIDRNNLEYMRLHLDVTTVERVLELLNAAPRIYLLGEGNFGFLAEAFASRLQMLGMNAHLVPTDPGVQSGILASLGPGDFCIGLGVTATSPHVVVFLKMARAAGATTLSIVGAMTVPIASIAEHVLYTPTSTAGLLPSMTCFVALLHGLSQALAIRRGYTMLDWALRTGNYLQEYAVALRTQVPAAEEILRTYSAPPSESPAPGTAPAG
ncbi:MAG: MurR/RpiR family transcriptional regulator [Anaerolineae bacterium]|nr:MurR/RpiR family transcriptional regulator [Anaerolineae bacterium]